jgi:hypothetical protein
VLDCYGRVRKTNTSMILKSGRIFRVLIRRRQRAAPLI